MIKSNFDIIVIGGGHAGCEAASASAKMGLSVAMITLDPSRIGFMSCNPAIGGLAKGQLVKEIDALGGVMGINTDKTAIQYRRLNSSKGPAVRSSRAQCDKALYSFEMKKFIAAQKGLAVISGEVSDITVKNHSVNGVILKDGTSISARSVIVTSGTFLSAIMHTGSEKSKGGRVGEDSAQSLSNCLIKLGFSLKRLKTGTPPRLDGRTIDFSKTISQPGDAVPVPFSFYFKPERFPVLDQVNCFITYTNKYTHEIIDKNISRSPMFSGDIVGIGPRYCPSIEDKVSRFRDKERHQIFLEPEGLTTNEIYVNGVSTSLPSDVQDEFIHSIVGLEKAEFTRYGYAVEYDAVDSRVLTSGLQCKDISGLFFGGQVNGTSGYEEAGAQGLMAGINAALFVKGEVPFSLSRMDGYIGVMIDDLVLKGSDEPYRMFTSRAEYRLLLREDNADIRLSKKGFDLGILAEADFRLFNAKQESVSKIRKDIAAFGINPNLKSIEYFTKQNWPVLKDRVSGEQLLRRPEATWRHVEDLGFTHSIGVDPVALEQVEVQIKYEGYIKRDIELLEGLQKYEEFKLPKSFNYERVHGLSTEIKEKLGKTRPETLGQIGRISGVTPAAVANILIFCKTHDEL